jgi:UDP-N-acetylmuramyl pentapeptide synthase
MTPLRELVAATAGAARLARGDAGAPVMDVTTDSRAVRPGALFAALPGRRADGHRFLGAAAAAGAAALLLEPEHAAAAPAGPAGRRGKRAAGARRDRGSLLRAPDRAA